MAKDVMELVEICAAAAKSGRRPRRQMEQLQDAIEADPSRVIEVLEAFAADASPEGRLDDGYLDLLVVFLTQLRFRVTSDDEDSIATVAEFQEVAVDLAQAGAMRQERLLAVSMAMHRANLPVSAAFSEALTEAAMAEAADAPQDGTDASLLPVIQAVFAEGGSAFDAYSMLAQSSHGLSEEARATLHHEFARMTEGETGEVMLFGLLDASAMVRIATAHGLSLRGTPPSPVMLRQLAAMRDWRPEREVGYMDLLLEAGRAAGLKPAPLATSRGAVFSVSAIDGAGAQGVLACCNAGSPSQVALASMVFKNGVSEADAFGVMPRKKAGMAMDHARRESQMRQVSTGFFEALLGRQLRRSIDTRGAPPPGLLSVAEMFGATGWRASVADWQQDLRAAHAALQPRLRTPDARVAALARSAVWTDSLAMTKSWFEIGAKVTRALAADEDRDPEEAVLADVLEPSRLTYAERLHELALWLRETDPRNLTGYCDVVTIATLLIDDVPMDMIPFMRVLAEMSATINLYGDLEPDRPE